MATTRRYLDWNATAPLCAPARDAMMESLQLPSNASAVHAEGRAARAAVERARRQVAALVGADAAHVTFTSGATEAANHVLTPEFRMGRAALSLGGLYVSAIEHPACREGGRFDRSRITEVPVTAEGTVDLDALAALLAAHDRDAGMPLVAVMLVNNETGIIQPVAQAAALAHAHGGMIVVDAVQAAGRIPVDIVALDADFMILSSHKIGGPKGAGALVAKGEVLMPKPLMTGGGQEKGHRSGTENVHAVVGFGAAAEAMATDLSSRNAAIGALRERLESGMKKAAPDVMIHGEDTARVPNTTFFTLPGLKAGTGQIAFDLEGIALSAGSACSSGKVGESYVLTAMGKDPALGALRISLGPETTADDVDQAVAAFTKIASRRRPAGQAA